MGNLRKISRNPVYSWILELRAQRPLKCVSGQPFSFVILYIIIRLGYSHSVLSCFFFFCFFFLKEYLISALIFDGYKIENTFRRKSFMTIKYTSYLRPMFHTVCGDLIFLLLAPTTQGGVSE